MTRTTDEMVASLRGQREAHETALIEWSTRFAGNPAHALVAVGSELFQRAADLEQCIQIGGFLSGEVNPSYTGDRLACAVKELEADVLRRAMDRPESTSPTSNLMENCRRVARAKVLAWMRGERGWI